MSPINNALPIPDFQDEACNITKNEILDAIDKYKIKYNPQFIGGITAYVPIYFDFGAIIKYGANERPALLRAVKTNITNLIKQVDQSLEKMDNINKQNVQLFLTRVVITNVAGKASTSKRSMFYPDGTLEVGTVFEDSINCSYYLEKKIVQALSEFRPQPGQVASEKIAAFEAPVVPVAVAAAPVQVQQPIYGSQSPSVVQPAVASSPVTGGSGNSIIDLSQPNYMNGAWETVKLEILALLVPLKVDTAYLGAPFEMPIYVDWGSIALSGADPTVVLRSIKSNYNNIVKQLLPAISKVDAIRKPMIRDFLVSTVLQNIAGKSSASKRAYLSPEGCLVIVTPFEDSVNCSYYLEKKITQGLNEFIPPSGGEAPVKYVAPVSQSPAPVAVAQPQVVPQQPAYGIPDSYKQQVQQPVYQSPPVQQPVYQQPPLVQQQPAYGIPDSYRPVQQPAYVPQYQPPVQVQQPVQPVVVPIPVPVIPEAPKEKGRVEMEWKPQIEDIANQFLVREIDAVLASFKLSDERDEVIGAPIYLDWKSVMIYPAAVKQSTILRNVNLAIYKLCREVYTSVKAACTDYAVRDNIKGYLRSVTIQNIAGISTGSKKVIYEDGHLTVQTIFEDFGNCALYFDSKIIQALQARPSAPAKKPDLITVIKEEVAVRINAHRTLTNKSGALIAPNCPVEMDWSFLTTKGYEGNNAETNVIAVTSGIFADYFAAIQTFKNEEIEILRREIVKVTFTQGAFGKTMFDKRTAVLADNGMLVITTIFEDRTEGAKTFREKFEHCFRARLYKVEIRDVLVPDLKAMIDRTVKNTEITPNRLDKIDVPSSAAYSSTVIFDWQLIEKEVPATQVATYAAVVQNIGTDHTFARMLRQSIADVNSYDVGRRAFVPTTQFVLRHIMRHKEQTIKYSDGMYEFFASFHDPANVHMTKDGITTFIKEKLLVAFPCAVQDTFPLVDKIQERLERDTGKRVPLTIDYDSWRTFGRYIGDTFAYRAVEGIVVEVPARGLEAISTLCKDAIVLREYKNKVNKIVVTYDTADGVKKQRKVADPNVVAKLDAAGTLTFTMNFSDARGNVKMAPWAYQLERVLGTRPMKVARAIERAQPDLTNVSQTLSKLVGKTIQVSVNYATFIDHEEFLIELEESVYYKIIASFSHLLTTGWINHEPSASLFTYATVKSAIQSQFNNVVFKVDCLSRQSSGYDFKLVGDTLEVSLNLTSAIKVETKEWRIELERVFKVRDLKVREEIDKRIDLKSNQDAISKVIGKPVTLVIDWASLNGDLFFSRNVDDYIGYMHLFAEEIASELATNYGFGEVCEYAEVQSRVQQLVSTIKLVAGRDGLHCSHSGTTLEVEVGIKNIRKFLGDADGDYDEYGRKIENALGVRLLMVKGYIKRNQDAVLGDAKQRLRDAVEVAVEVVVDWQATIEQPSFVAIADYKPILQNMINMANQLHPMIQLCRENTSAKKALQAVRTYTIRYDANNRINESEFAENKFGVEWIRTTFMAPPARDHILITCNLEPMRNNPHSVGIEDKVEFLVTPDLAEERYQKRLARKDREEDLQHRRAQEAKEDRWRDEQRRMDDKMLDASHERNRQLDRMNRRLRW